MQELIDLINNSNKIVFFIGAGVSTLSGLKDFRSKDGLYNKKCKYPPEEILSNTFFWNNTKEFYNFYKENLNSLNYKPNIVHTTIKELENKNKVIGVITQNIDGFEEDVNIKNLYQIHGSIKRNYCCKCHRFYDANYVFNSTDIPLCDVCNNIVKPDVVLYEERLDDNVVSNAINKIRQADLLIILGTSLNVYPAASFINYSATNNIVLINKDKTTYDRMCKIVIHDDLKEVFNYIKDFI